MICYHDGDEPRLSVNVFSSIRSFNIELIIENYMLISLVYLLDRLFNVKELSFEIIIRVLISHDADHGIVFFYFSPRSRYMQKNSKENYRNKNDP